MTERADQDDQKAHRDPSRPVRRLIHSPPLENLADMPHRISVSLFLFAAFPIVAIALTGGSRPPLANADAKDQPPDPKLEHKNFVEKVASYKTIADVTTKKTTRID